MEEGLPIYHGQGVPRTSAMGYYSGTGDDYQRSQTHSAQPPPLASTTSNSGTSQGAATTSSMSFYPSAVASNDYYPRHDAYAPSALYGAHHVVRNPASTPSSPYYYSNDHSLALDPASPAPIRKAGGFRRVRDQRDLRTALTSSHPAVSTFLELFVLSGI